MITPLLWSLALAGGTRLDLPVPLHPDPDQSTTCTTIDGADLDVPPTTIDDGRWEVTCRASEGRYQICLRVLDTHAPRKPIPLRCEGEKTWLQVRPFVAYDRLDDPRDGVHVRKGVVETMFFATDLPDASGEMRGGTCGVLSSALDDGTVLRSFILRPFRPLRRDRVCTLTFPDGRTQEVPVTVVKTVEALGPS